MMMLRQIVVVLLLIISGMGVRAEMPILQMEVSINAPIDTVWNAWTSEDGLAFISPESNIELRIGGAYEWFLDGEPDELGKRGSEGSHILAYLPDKMIAFSWTFPPAVPELRIADERTQVVVLLDEADGQVRVRLYAHGWQDGEPWQSGWEYFDHAWRLVLDRMKSHLEAIEQTEATAGS
jgi:uncharacterized protein YndB with AHSA1/START domain